MYGRPKKLGEKECKYIGVFAIGLALKQIYHLFLRSLFNKKKKGEFGNLWGSLREQL